MPNRQSTFTNLVVHGCMSFYRYCHLHAPYIATVQKAKLYNQKRANQHLTILEIQNLISKSLICNCKKMNINLLQNCV